MSKSITGYRDSQTLLDYLLEQPQLVEAIQGLEGRAPRRIGAAQHAKLRDVVATNSTTSPV